MKHTAFLLFLLVFLVITTGAYAAKSAWSYRCSGEGEQKHCEIFQRLMVKDTQSRFVEMAVAHHPTENGYQALIYLPLGISIPPGIGVEIDGEEILREQIQFCIASGCIMGLNLSHHDLLQRMHNGKKLTLSFKSPDGTPITADLILKGFKKTFKKLN